MGGAENRGHGRSGLRTVNLKYDLPPVGEALARLDREIALARQQGFSMLKIVHGYGSSGAGGDIRIAVQLRLRAMEEGGVIRCCIFGENWSKADDVTWAILKASPELKHDSDLGRGNRGITIVVLA